jgi:predicted component of type VI protein secretion system
MKRYGIEAPLAAGPARVKPIVNRAAQHPKNPAVAAGAAGNPAASNFVTPTAVQAASTNAASQDADLSGFDNDAEGGSANDLNAIEGIEVDPILDVYLYDSLRDTAYTLTGKTERIGREATCEIVVPDINASRVHAEIRLEPTGAWVITDLGSTNGLYINGRKIKSAPLRDADMITIGTTELEFQKLS